MNLKKLILFFIMMLTITTLFLSSQEAADYKTYSIREVNGQKVEVHVFMPEVKEDRSKRSSILLFHGGGWRWGSASWTFKNARLFAKQGMVAFAVEYRLSKGNITPVDAIEDTCAAFRWVRKHSKKFNIDPAKVAGHGVSAGGHLVTMAAIMADKEDSGNKFSCRPDALLLWSPALDVVNDGWFRRLIKDQGNAGDYSPADLSGRSTPPSCIIQGDKDTLTLLAGANKFCKNIINAGGICEMNIYPGVGHLLTRNLANQEDDFDPHPEYRRDGRNKFIKFLLKQGFITKAVLID
ncbi:MAG: alpha/beta hydrolase [Acidobacteriota bacterium]